MKAETAPRTRSAIESDADLVASCLAGAGDAFRELVRRHMGMVMSCAYRVLKDHHEAEDVSHLSTCHLSEYPV